MSTEINTMRLPNGMTLVHEAMPWLPSLSFSFLLRAGAVSDPEGQEGSAVVLHDWLERGAAERNSREFSEALDALGVRRGGGAGKESITFSASLLADSFSETMALYADMLRRPRLEADDFEGARTLALQEIASLEDNPAQKLFDVLSRKYFASAHGRSAYGTVKGLQALTPESVCTDAEARVSPQGLILSVAGGVTWDEIKSVVETHFGDWQGAAFHETEVKVNPAASHHLEADTSQVQIGLAYEGLPPSDEHWYAQALAMSVLSGGSAARLFTEVREKRGLVYSVTATNRAIRGYGYSLGYAGTTPERANETLEVMLAELRRIREGVTEDEFERARTGLLSNLIMQGESSGARAGAMARDVLLLGEARTIDSIKAAVDAVSFKDLNQFLANRPEPEFTILTLGPKALAPAEAVG